MKSMTIFMIVAGVSIVVGIVFRALGTYAVLNLTPNAFLRFADTMLLFAIAIGVYFLSRQKAA